AGMVLPAVLCDPARGSEQARRRRGAAGFDSDPRLPAVVRYVASALGALPAALPAVFLGVRGGLRRARLARLEACRRRICYLGAYPDHLLLSPLPDHFAHPRFRRDDQAAAELD